MVGFYVGTFIGTGMFVGALRPLLNARFAIYAALAAGGAIVMDSISVADDGVSGMHSVDWLSMSVARGMLGIAAACGYLKRS